jgi:glutathione S-transferase
LDKYPVLYTFRRCPFAIRARLALCLNQRQCEVREIKLSDKPLDMIKRSSKGTVPVLILNDGNVLDESIDIMRWSFDQNYKTNDELELWISKIDTDFKYHLDRYKYPNRYHNTSPHDHRDACLDMLKKLEVSWGTIGIEGGLNFYDFAFLTLIRQFRMPERDWFDALDLDFIQKRLEFLITSNLFSLAMQKYPLWDSSEIIYLI